MLLIPFTQKLIGEVLLCDWAEADAWLDGAVKLHGDRKAWLPAYQRWRYSGRRLLFILMTQ